VAVAKVGIVNGPCSDGTTCPHSTTCQAPGVGANGTRSGDDRCLHKPLLPLNEMDWVAIGLLFTSCALAAGGGIGGGGLLVSP
jgi:hypothetical protein